MCNQKLLGLRFAHAERRALEAIRRFVCFASEILSEKFIRFVLEEFALVGNPAEQVIGDQLLARAGLSLQERPQATCFICFALEKSH